MNKKWVWGFPLAVAIAIAAGKLMQVQDAPNSVANHKLRPQSTAPEQPANELTKTSAAENSHPWLQHPQVQAYLKRQADKDAMRAYFNSDDNDPEQAQAMWDYIESLEQSNAVMGFEALHLKMAWLEKNSASEEEFKNRTTELMEKFRREAHASAAKYNPENTPEFKNYKQQEKAIVAEVQNMTSFPDGMTQQAYLRQRLLEARVDAYQGETNADSATDDDDDD